MAGDRELEELRRTLLARARVLVRDVRSPRLDAEELVQDVMEKVVERLRRGPAIENLSGYALVSLSNRLVDLIRRGAREAPMPDEGARPEERAAPPDAASDPEIRDVLEKLPPKERCFLWKVVFEDVAVQTAQKQCGWPPRAPFYHLERLLQRVARMIDA
jgi:RNA polymerase sigma factor (sigma-70 family)